MKKFSKKITRRDFLKRVGCITAGIFALQFKRLFDSATRVSEKDTPKEAKYYTRSDNLAG